MKLLLILYIFSINCFADIEYRWIHLEPQNILTGGCYEMEKGLKVYNFKQQQISGYIKKVRPDKCRTSKTYHMFNLKNGKCYEADFETDGHKYIKSTELKECRPKETAFKFLEKNNRVDCYEVDKKSLGSQFFKKVKNKLCIHEKSKVKWVQKSSEFGKCFDVTDSLSRPPHIPEEYCYPAKKKYIFKKTDEFKGICILTSMDESTFRKKVKIEMCSPKESKFIYFKKAGEKKGRCLEIDSETLGKKYVNRVDDNNCKNTIKY